MTTLLIVDDAHLLDPASAALVHQLATTGTRLLLSVHSDGELPPAVAALIRAGHVVDLHPFDEGETASLVGGLLGGAVDTAVPDAMLSATRGNPLFIRELVHASVQAGVLTRRVGIWVLTGDFPQVDTITRTVRSQLDSAGGALTYAVQLVAVAGMLPLAQARSLVDMDVLERAEGAGFLSANGSPCVRLTLTLPLYREVIIDDLTALRRRRLIEDLRRTAGEWDQIEEYQLNAARWKLELGEPIGGRELVLIADAAQACVPDVVHDLEIAAPDAASRVAALIALARSVDERRLSEDTDAVLADLAAGSLTAEQRAEVIEIQARRLSMAANRPLDAVALLDDAANAHVGSAGLVVARATALWRAGRVAEALLAAQASLRDSRASTDDIARAADVAWAAATSAGRAEEATQSFRRIEPADGSSQSAPTKYVDDARVTRAVTQAQDFGDPELIRRSCEDGYRRSLQARNDGDRARYALHLGWAEVVMGNVTAGLPRLWQANALHDAFAHATFPSARARLVEVLVLAGEVERAGQELGSLERMTVAGLYAGRVSLARAAVMAGETRFADAAALVRHAAEDAESLGQRLPALELHYTALRMGDATVADDVIRLCRTADSPQREAVAAHARAVQSSDARALEEAGHRLERCGFLWYAVDAQAAALARFRAAGDQRGCLFAAERLNRLLRRCSGLHSPVAREQLHTRLTARESQVAFLAAKGMSSARIGERLDISARTVELHLSHVYGKLTVHGRRELADLLRDPHPPVETPN